MEGANDADRSEPTLIGVGSIVMSSKRLESGDMSLAHARRNIFRWRDALPSGQDGPDFSG